MSEKGDPGHKGPPGAHPIQVLDHGFVSLVDAMGSDRAICQAARVSNSLHLSEVDPAKDRSLLRYLMWHKHTSPFEMCELKFHMKLPIFVARQMVRHRTASINEVSGRYVDLSSADFYVPALEDVCSQSQSNKQGRGEAFVPEAAEEVLAQMSRSGWEDRRHYSWMTQVGVAKELARTVLPLGTYTEWYWKIDLHNLLHFLNLRQDEHAQLEIRRYAHAIHELVAPLFPVTLEAWEHKRQVEQEFKAAMDARWKELGNG